MSDSHLFINNQWLQGHGEDFMSVNPATNKLLWVGNAADETQISQAVDCARSAFPAWSSLPAEHRIDYINIFKTQLSLHQEQLATIIAIETGKPLWESKTEVSALIGKIDISIQAYHQRTGSTTSENNGITASTTHKAHGIVAVLGPYNFPGHLPNGHIVPALIAGNCVLFKPSELTPNTAEFIVKLWQDAELPAGVLSLLQGGVETAKALVNHQQIDGIFFTGSSSTGLALHQQLAMQPQKILALEMGGNNPLVVATCKDINAAVFQIIQSAYITSGQRCTCARRLIVPNNNEGDELIEKLINSISGISIGHYHEHVYMGSVISTNAAKHVNQHFNELIKLGATSLVEPNIEDERVAFITPSLIDVTSVTNLPDSECFGPLLKVIRYDDFEQALSIANDTQFGLSAGLLADDLYLYNQFYHQIRAGIVNWNTPLTGASSAAPFGGVGASGNHRPSAYYAADYCAYPVASMQSPSCSLPEKLPPGLKL